MVVSKMLAVKGVPHYLPMLIIFSTDIAVCEFAVEELLSG